MDHLDEGPAPPGARVGVIGLGNMGIAMAAALRDAGWQVVGHDTDPGARTRAGDVGITCASALADVRCPQVVLSLPSAAVVRTVVPALLATGNVETVVDTTTSDPPTTTAMERVCREAGAVFVDAPVSGGPTGARAGSLTAFVGGTDEAVARAGALLAALTASWTHLGPAGSGNVVKLANNMLFAASMAAVAEALDVIAAHGLDLGPALAAVNTASGRSAVSQTVFAEAIIGGAPIGGFSVGLMARDVTLGLEFAAAAGATPAVLEAVERAWARALRELGPQADCTEAPAVFTTATRCFAPVVPAADSETRR